MRAIEIKLPAELAEELGLESAKELESHARLLLAIDLYMSGKISLGRAAELAGLSYDEFLGSPQGKRVENKSWT